MVRRQRQNQQTTAPLRAAGNAALHEQTTGPIPGRQSVRADFQRNRLRMLMLYRTERQQRASQPTKPAFGSTDFSTLYITSARDGLDEAALASQPYAGALFVADAGFRGLPEPRFPGPPPHVIAAA